jgi:hypothetical protein
VVAATQAGTEDQRPPLQGFRLSASLTSIGDRGHLAIGEEWEMNPSATVVIADTKRRARQAVGAVVEANPELAAVEFTVEAVAGPPGPTTIVRPAAVTEPVAAPAQA